MMTNDEEQDEGEIGIGAEIDTIEEKENVKKVGEG